VAADNPLEEYFRNNDGRLIHKWMHYFDVYHRHFERFRNQPVVVVEFGVSQGGSLEMWRNYFGDQATIYGIDIDERCAALDGPGTHVLIGDQEDREFLRSVGERTGPIDVLIEDGGHTMGQQLATFAEMYPLVKEGGVFLIEDLHTSYWEEYGGGYRRRTRSCGVPNSSPTSSTPGAPGTAASSSTSSRGRPARCTSTTASSLSRRAAWSSLTTR
jgi:hypothetical protein